MAKPKYEREVDQLEALHLAWRRGKAPSCDDPRFALAFGYLNKLERAARSSREAARVKAEQERAAEQRAANLRDALRAQWGRK